ADEDFRELEELVEERREYRSENGGQTIYLGSVDSFDRDFDGGQVYDSKDFDDVDRMLEEGMTPEEIVESDNPELERSGGESGEVIRTREEDIRLVYLSDGGERPLESYAESLRQAFHNLEPSIDLEVAVDEVEPDEEDLRALEDISSGEFEGMKADLNLKAKYSEDGEEPVFLVENDLLLDAGGHSDYMTGVAFVELGENEDANRHVVNHETGHSVLMLPHHFHESGAMSYNPEADHDTGFHSRSRMMAKAVMTGDTEYEVVDRTVSGIFDGEMQEKEYKQVKVDYTPRDLGTEQVSEDFFDHLDTYAREVLGYDMGSWTPESRRLVEEDGETYDIATYRHDDGSEMVLKVGDYIEDMRLETAPT
ncbi:MAG: hypothetical protein ABEI58_02910, partial [Candidatus Nanohaloarchaea archaeon]